MFLEERQQKIFNIIKKEKRVEVQNLKEVFKYSEDTIRRDLRMLEDKGLIKRTYGGAILLDKTGISLTVKQREELEPEKKEKIAKLASKFIEDNDTIFLDGSTTVAKLIPYLNNFNNLTIITNSISIANEIIIHNLDLKLYLIGGLVFIKSAITLGMETLETIKRISVDKVFTGVCSISSKWGLSTPLIEEAHIYKSVLESGRSIYLMVDSSKFETKSIANIGPIKPEYTIITDRGLSEENLKEFNSYIKKGLRIMKA